MTLNTRYSPKATEEKWYAHWMKKNYFHSVPDEREPYSIVIPPPNVTGVLHMGHMLNNTIQDILIQKSTFGRQKCLLGSGDGSCFDRNRSQSGENAPRKRHQKI